MYSHKYTSVLAFLRCMLVVVLGWSSLAAQDPCSNVTITPGGSNITIGGLNGAPIAFVQVFNGNWQQVFVCQGNCNTPSQLISNLPNGQYFVKVDLLTASYTPICKKEGYYQVTGTGGSCSLTYGSTVTNKICNDNGTPSNPNDDTWTVSFTPTVLTNPNNLPVWGWHATINGVGMQGMFGSPKALGPFPISAGNLVFNLTDDDNPTCSQSYTITPPSPCSNAAPIPTISINDVSVNESAGSASLTVTLSAPSASPVTVQYSTSSGSALSGSDYTNASGTVTFPAGMTSKSIPLTIVSDGVAESTESFSVNLTNGTGANIADNTGIVTILDGGNGTPNCNNIAITGNTGSIGISGLTAPITTVQVFNASWAQVFNQTYTSAPGTATIPSLAAGVYYVKVAFYTTAWSLICQKDGYFTVGGPGNVCTLTLGFTEANKVCNDNGTPNNPADDTWTVDFTAKVLANPNGLPSWGWNATINGVGTQGMFDMPKKLGPFSIAAGNLTFTYTDDDNPTCTKTVTITPPNPCSGGNPCSVNINVANLLCDGKGTATTSDDTYTFNFTVTGTGTGATWSGGYSNPYLGSFLFGPTPYGTVIPMGPFPAGAFTAGNTVPPIVLANGLNIDINVSDTQNSSCTKNLTVNSPGPCSPTSSPCDNVTITATPGSITVTGLNSSPVVLVQVFNSTWTQVFNCAGNCTLPTQIIPNLPAGSYYVKVSLLTAQWTTICQKEITITVPPPGNPGSIGDCVWNDLNKNGIKEPGEPGVPGVTVQLKDCNGNTITTTTTNSTGFYNFPNLNAGCYKVCVVLPVGYLYCPQNQGNNDAADSDISSVDGCTANINLAQGQNDPTQDAGICLPSNPGSIGDCVWNDLNKNGIKENTEVGVPNVTVQLKDCVGNTITTTTTNASGFYNFPNLNAGCYTVCVVLPAGYQFSPQNQGGNDATDSDMNPTGGCTANINLTQGQNDPTQDAGIYLPPTVGSIGDCVWNDLNKNGIKENTEAGVPNVTVQLKDCVGNTITTTTTNASGFYNFPNLNAGCYTVCVVLPAGYQFSPQNQGGNDATDSDMNPTGGCTSNINLTQGQNDPTQDAGIYQPPTVGSIGDCVWNDLNKNGIKENTEVGVPNVTVQLKDCNGNTITTTTTNASGFYNFPNLNAGCYKVCVVLPAGYQYCPQNQGNNDTVDSDISTVDGCTANINLVQGQNDPTQDAGICQPTVNIVCKNLFATTTTGAAVVSYMPPTATTTCTTGSLVFARTSGPASGSSFPVGTTQVCYTVTDGCGSTATCCFNVTVTTCAAPTSDYCFVSPTKPNTVSAKISVVDNGTSYTVRTTFAKTFVDNTYGTNAIGWPNGHKFSDLVGSDNLQLALFNAANTKVLEFKIDYISAASGTPSGYDCLGVTGGEGKMLVGSASNVISATTSQDQNMNTFGYNLQTNSPATDANYTPNPAQPNWIYDVWYEVTVLKSAFSGGMGAPMITSVHASPSKTGSNTEAVNPTPCPPATVCGPIVLNCPANVSASPAAGATTANVTYAAPTGTTTCANGGLTITRISGPASGSAFPIGTTQVCYFAMDNCGNVKECCFNVIVCATPPGTNYCFVSPTKPSIVSAKINVIDNGTSYTVRTTFAKTFVDNTYGTNAIGWPNGHKFSDLVGSDNLQLALFNAANTKVLEFKIDYISAASGTPSGYDCLGVTGGEGKMLVGSASNVISATTSQDQNMNTFGYNLQTNSPATNASYAPNTAQPNWIYDVWYEVTVLKSAFSGGMGAPMITSVHASPSKTGSNTEAVNPTPCPPVTNPCTGNYVASVHQLTFDAFRKGYDVELKWINNTGDLNEFFDIERSIDGVNFVKIGRVDGKGGSAGDQLYFQSFDRKPSAGDNIYRLKMVWKDGTVTYSNEKTVHFDEIPAIGIYPNPATEELNIDLSKFVGEKVEISMVNNLGIVVFTQTVKQATEEVHRIDLGNFQSGSYRVIIQPESARREVRQVIVEKF